MIELEEYGETMAAVKAAAASLEVGGEHLEVLDRELTNPTIRLALMSMFQRELGSNFIVSLLTEPEKATSLKIKKLSD